MVTLEALDQMVLMDTQAAPAQLVTEENVEHLEMLEVPETLDPPEMLDILALMVNPELADRVHLVNPVPLVPLVNAPLTATTTALAREGRGAPIRSDKRFGMAL